MTPAAKSGRGAGVAVVGDDLAEVHVVMTNVRPRLRVRNCRVRAKIPPVAKTKFPLVRAAQPQLRVPPVSRETRALVEIHKGVGRNRADSLHARSQPIWTPIQNLST